MVRKQLYISEEHERALKARARELGVSEAELVRWMLDGLLLEGEGGRGLAGAGAAEALEGSLEKSDVTPNNGVTYTVIIEDSQNRRVTRSLEMARSAMMRLLGPNTRRVHHQAPLSVPRVT